MSPIGTISFRCSSSSPSWLQHRVKTTLKAQRSNSSSSLVSWERIPVVSFKASMNSSRWRIWILASDQAKGGRHSNSTSSMQMALLNFLGSDANQGCHFEASFFSYSRRTLSHNKNWPIWPSNFFSVRYSIAWAVWSKISVSSRMFAEDKTRVLGTCKILSPADPSPVTDTLQSPLSLPDSANPLPVETPWSRAQDSRARISRFEFGPVDFSDELLSL
mmetsp:Transcript_12520/g.31531  ORF Transcript_12520/g.31531 Transcript_12520/m.31531 type:complete len:218 (-) Transcript_12520:204-857(-)